MTAPCGAVVIGLGNIVLSDDGVGVHAVRRLRERGALPDVVELIEGGTAGLLLLPHLADARHVVIVDAIDSGKAPGTHIRLDGADWAKAFAVRMTPHDIGLADLLGAAQLSAAWPEELVLHGVQPGSTQIGTELSTAVADAVDPLLDALVAELAAWGFPPGQASDRVASAACA